MATPTLDRALPWLRLAFVAGGSAAILIAAPSLPWVRLATAPALAIGMVQLFRLGRAAIRQPQRDREADDRLQVLLDRTCLPDVHLVEVVATEHASAAGQRALTIDLDTGHPARLWFSQAFFPTGSLILVEVQPGSVRSLDWMPHAEVEAAYRHRRRAARSHEGDEAKWKHELALDLAARRHGRRGNGLQAAPDRTRAA